MKTKLQILEETYNFYKNNPDQRAIGKNSLGLVECMYLTFDGRKCAVGRCQIEPNLFFTRRVDDIWPTSEKLDETLKPEYRGHDIDFWTDLQSFHDFDSNWDENGISSLGETQYQTLVKRHS